MIDKDVIRAVVKEEIKKSEQVQALAMVVKLALEFCSGLDEDSDDVSRDRLVKGVRDYYGKYPNLSRASG